MPSDMYFMPRRKSAKPPAICENMMKVRLWVIN
jgi:hypothetical protein